MADFENSRSLPANTTGNKSAADKRESKLQSEGRITSDQIAQETMAQQDPVMAVWWQWAIVNQQLSQTIRQHNELQEELSRIASPSVLVDLPVGGTATVWSEAEIDSKFRQWPGMLTARIEAKTRLSTACEHWQRHATRLGYFDLAALEEDLSQERLELSTSLLSMTSRSCAGVAAKLACYLDIFMPDEANELDATYPQPLPSAALRSILADLITVAGEEGGLIRP